MGGSACTVIITNGNKAYAAVEELNSRYTNISATNLEAAITASCDLTVFVGLYTKIEGNYLEESFTQPIIDLHARIISELVIVDRKDTQALVDELTSLLFAACNNLSAAIT